MKKTATSQNKAEQAESPPAPAAARLGKRDFQVLRALDGNGRLAASAVAKQIGVSKHAVLRRLHSLSEKGVVRRVYALVDETKLGKTLYRVFVRLEGVSQKQLLDFLTLHPSVQGFAYCGGAFQLLLSLSCKDGRELDEALFELERKFPKAVAEKRVQLVAEKIAAGNGFAYHSQAGFSEREEQFEEEKPLRGRVSYWDLVPTLDDFAQLQKIMAEMRLKGAGLDLRALVEPSLAESAYEKVGGEVRKREWR